MTMSRDRILRRLSGLTKLAVGALAAHHKIEFRTKMMTDGQVREVIGDIDVTIVNVDLKSALAVTELHAREIGLTFNGESQKHSEAMKQQPIMKLSDAALEAYLVAELRRIRRRLEGKDSISPES